MHPAQAWAVSPESAGTLARLIQCQLTLATKICQAYDLDPQALSQLTRYVYMVIDENVGGVRFVSTERDLFDGIRFLGPRRVMLKPGDGGGRGSR